MKIRISLGLTAAALAFLACSEGTSMSPATVRSGGPVLEPTIPAPSLGIDRTAFGFFPAPPRASLASVLSHFEDLGQFGDLVLIQPNVPWQEFSAPMPGDSQAAEDLRNLATLARQNGLQWIFVVDPLNGLDRTEFFGLPTGWTASFGDAEVRAAYLEFVLWILDEFQPAYLGLASEINTYMDAHPDDVEEFVTLYTEAYEQIKLQAPGTRVFVTFQWDDLNNMIPAASEGRPPFEPNWEQVEAFEPNLDIWAISSYPYFVFNGAKPIPADYYTPLLSRTDKPLAVAESGFASQPVGPIDVSPEHQQAFMNAIYAQLGDRLAFWVYLLLSDLDMASIEEAMQQEGRTSKDIETLSMFSSVGLREVDGTPKPALETWIQLRQDESDLAD